MPFTSAISSLPSSCMRGKPITVEHAFSCPFGSFPSIRHNELRDITATLLSEVCSNVRTKLPLQPCLENNSITHLLMLKMVLGLM